MDNNQKRFVEDALDLLNELDEGLLQLEAHPQATAPLEQVFRTMQTIKGGANMFGFENIGELAHHLETLYDLVRQGKMQVSDGLISITLHAFDKVRDLLKEKDATRIANAEELKDHLKMAIAFLKSAETESMKVAQASVQPISKKDQLATFFFRISPTVNMTIDGNPPLVFIIQDLEALGTARTFHYKKSDGNIAHWDVYLSTTSAQTEIESYFLFVESAAAEQMSSNAEELNSQADELKAAVSYFKLDNRSSTTKKCGRTTTIRRAVVKASRVLGAEVHENGNGHANGSETFGRTIGQRLHRILIKTINNFLDSPNIRVEGLGKVFRGLNPHKSGLRALF